MEGVHGEALEATDFDGLLVVAVHHAGAFAEDVYGAGARATGAENVGVEDRFRGTFKIAGGNLLDELGHVDVRGASGHAGSVEAVETAMGFGDGRGFLKRRMEVRKARGNVTRGG